MVGTMSNTNKFDIGIVCPQCSNILTVSPSPENGRNRLECRTCPYQHAIEDPMYARRFFKKKEREDVFGGPEAWDNAQKTATQCPTGTCEGQEAAFYQVQIRSADEPMTSFLKVSTSPAFSAPSLMHHDRESLMWYQSV